MSNYNSIRKAVETQLDGISGLPQAVSGTNNIVWENNSGFKPQADDSWLRVRLDPTRQRPSAVGVGVKTKHEGVFFIDTFTSEGNGPAVADTLADLVISNFTYGLTLTADSQNVLIRFSEREGGFSEPPWYHIPILISWYSFV